MEVQNKQTNENDIIMNENYLSENIFPNKNQDDSINFDNFEQCTRCGTQKTTKWRHWLGKPTCTDCGLYFHSYDLSQLKSLHRGKLPLTKDDDVLKDSIKKRGQEFPGETFPSLQIALASEVDPKLSSSTPPESMDCSEFETKNEIKLEEKSVLTNLWDKAFNSNEISLEECSNVSEDMDCLELENNDKFENNSTYSNYVENLKPWGHVTTIYNEIIVPFSSDRMCKYCKRVFHPKDLNGEFPDHVSKCKKYDKYILTYATCKFCKEVFEISKFGHKGARGRIMHHLEDKHKKEIETIEAENIVKGYKKPMKYIDLESKNENEIELKSQQTEHVNSNLNSQENEITEIQQLNTRDTEPWGCISGEYNGEIFEFSSERMCRYCKRVYHPKDQNVLPIHEQKCKKYHQFVINRTTCTFCQQVFEIGILRHLERDHMDEILKIQNEKINTEKSKYEDFIDLESNLYSKIVSKQYSVYPSSNYLFYTCKNCQKVYQSSDAFKKLMIHIKTCKKPNETVNDSKQYKEDYRCDLCNFISEQHEYFCSHMSFAHDVTVFRNQNMNKL